jgi:Ran GTPase-activating protein (RanGAP) involved in mRNA processing and transport
VADILQLLNHIHGDLRKLILQDCWLGKDGTGLLANIVTLYPDLEALSLQGCRRLTSDSYRLIPRLKKLSELNLSYCQVHYVYVKLLETHVCICEHM